MVKIMNTDFRDISNDGIPYSIMLDARECISL